MADPFTAIGLAGNIAQFIDFSFKLFSASRIRINGRFKGLLEVSIKSSLARYDIASREDHKVDFLHRTVKDFLLTKGCQDQIKAWIPKGVSVYYSLTQAYLADLKELSSRCHLGTDSYPFEDILTNLFFSARKYERRPGRNLKALYKELDRLFEPTKYYKNKMLHDSSLIHFAIRHDALGFLTTMLLKGSVVITRDLKAEYLNVAISGGAPRVILYLAQIGPTVCLKNYDLERLTIRTAKSPESVQALTLLCRRGIIRLKDFTPEQRKRIEDDLSPEQSSYMFELALARKKRRHAIKKLVGKMISGEAGPIGDDG